MYKDFKHCTEENADTRILRVVLRYAEGEEIYAEIINHLPEDCRDRFVELWEESEMAVKDLFNFRQSENKWMEYDNLKQQREVLQNFVERYMDRAGYSRHQDVGGTMLSNDGWNQYLRRVGRGEAKDRDYCIRLCFVLRLSNRESQRLFEITGQAPWEERIEREFMLHKMLVDGMYDGEIVDGYLLERGMKPLFASSEQRRRQNGIAEILNQALADKMKEKFGKFLDRRIRNLCNQWNLLPEIADKMVKQALSEDLLRVNDSEEPSRMPLFAYDDADSPLLISQDVYQNLPKKVKEAYREICDRYIAVIRILKVEAVRMKVYACRQMMAMDENEWYSFRGIMGGENSNTDKLKNDCRTLCRKLSLTAEAAAELMKLAIADSRK